MTSCQLTLQGTPPRAEIKPRRWISIEEQKDWVEFLIKVGLTALTPDLKWCASMVAKYRCDDNPLHSIHCRYLLCGKRGICVRCSMSYANKRARIMYQWIKDNLAQNLDFDLKMNQIVLTLPQPLHDMNPKTLVKMIKEFMSRFDIQSYGYCIQNRHSENPLSGKYLHCHVLSLNFKVENNQIQQSDYYFDVERMRAVWKQIITDYTGVDVEGKVNLFTEYSSILNNPNKVIHMLSYCYRYPIADLFLVQIRNKSINYVQGGQFEKSESPNDILQFDLDKRILELVGEQKTRLVWVGWLTSAKRKDLIKIMEMPKQVWKSIKQVVEKLEARSKNCRDCGLPLQKEPFEITLYEGDNEPDSLNHYSDLEGVK